MKPNRLILGYSKLAGHVIRSPETAAFRPSSLDDIGDEAYSSDGGRGRLWRVRFRKAAVYVEIGAPSLSLAMRIARDLEKKITKEHKPE